MSTLYILGVLLEAGSHLVLEWMIINSQSAPNYLI